MLQELEQRLSELSHDASAIYEIQAFCNSLKGTLARLQIWNAANAIVRPPIEPALVHELGFNSQNDDFSLLQGDLVRTESAYFLGERITAQPKYAVLNSSCDLVRGRAAYASLVRILEVRSTHPSAKSIIGELVKFTRRDSMYVPPLPDDSREVIGNVIQFDGICQIRMDDLLLASRIASLSLVGWRIFASFTRTVLARANPREVEIRTAIESAG